MPEARERSVSFANTATFLAHFPQAFQSASAGAAEAGGAPVRSTIGSVRAPDHFSTKKKIAGTKKMPIRLAANIPPITVVPMIWRATAPAPLAVQSGTQPRMNAKEVIRIGRRRSLGPSGEGPPGGF